MVITGGYYRALRGLFLLLSQVGKDRGVSSHARSSTSDSRPHAAAFPASVAVMNPQKGAERGFSRLTLPTAARLRWRRAPLPPRCPVGARRGNRSRRNAANLHRKPRLSEPRLSHLILFPPPPIRRLTAASALASGLSLFTCGL